MPQGRSPEHPLIEDCMTIDLAEPSIRATLSPTRNSTGTWTWSVSGRSIGSIGYRWDSVRPALYLEFSASGAPVRQEILLEASHPRFGGVRWWFICPFTRRRVRALHLPPGTTRFASRHAYRLTYRSRRERSFRQVLNTLAKHDPDPVAAERWRRLGTLEQEVFGVAAEARIERQWKGRVRRNHVRRLRRSEQVSGR